VTSGLTDKPLRDVLSEFSSGAPIPGGGSACAAASAIGAALLVMATSLAKTRTDSSDDRSALDGAHRVLDDIQRQLTDAIDADPVAYGRVVAARRQPNSSDVERRERTSAVQGALRGATDVPLGIMRLSAAALEEARPVAAHAHRAADADIAVAITLLRAGFEGARLTVAANLRIVTDSDYVNAVNGECLRLAEQTESAARITGHRGTAF
jgi:formiminotetrahydrofolate cyclodeaminase